VPHGCGNAGFNKHDVPIYEAKEHLQAWLEADLALATGKEYTIGNRRLTRANVQEVKDRINFWRNEVARLENRPRRRAYRVIPRDI